MHLGMSEQAKPLYEKVKQFITTEIEPQMDELTGELYKEGRWVHTARFLEILDGLKSKAKAAGLWNLFLTEGDYAVELSTIDYAYMATEMGRLPWAAEVFNCAAPDTGNMEVISKYGTKAQQKEWLEPLLNGDIRSAYAMTERDHASSDATNVCTQAVLDGDEWVINGAKHYISGAGDPRCKVMIVMVQTDADAPKHKQQSQILVPMNAEGVNVIRGMAVFGHDDAPHGHMEIVFDNVRVPKDNVLLGIGRGFEISQGRLGPGRIHHCMRSLGAAEQALELLCRRGLSRTAFGKPLAKLGGNIDVIANARMEIEMCRLLVLKAAWAMDNMPISEARVWVSMAKVRVPIMACKVIDDAIQMHGALGISQDTPLAEMYTGQRTLRLADGPDEVHRMVVGRHELRKYENK
jgi:acyl-CoA dehydrogenase